MRFKQVIAEFIGTMTLVIAGCGTAMLVGCDASVGSGYILTAFAFGLSVVAMAYSIGNISGCHINPAVSFAMLISGRINFSQFVDYLIAQCMGAILGAALLAVIFKLGNLNDLTSTFGANGLANISGSAVTGLIIEIILTFIFVITVLGATSDKAKHGSHAGLVIGLSLVLVHIIGIGLTGTSVNPARSIGPAIIALISGTSGPVSCVWVFIAGPMAGAALAAVVYSFLESSKK